MENHIQNIELINNYLNKTLSDEESKAFENKLKTDEVFKALFEEHLILIEGIKRQAIKTEIKKGKQSFIRNKWLKYFGLGGLTVLMVIACFNLFNSKQNGLGNKLNFESVFIQNYQVAVDSIIEIVGEKGTVIRFNPKDLETSSGSQFSGDKLSVELIELTTKQELLLANAQTVSNGRWLISGGAFKIDIIAKGESLILKKGKTIGVQFPKNALEDDMQIFYGERNRDGNLNWNTSEIKLEDKKLPFVIYIEDLDILDVELTKRYGVYTFKIVNVIDTLGRVSVKDIFPKINYFDKNADTIRVYKEEIGITQKGENYSEEYYKVVEVESISILENKKEIIIDSILIDLEDMIYGEGYSVFTYAYKQISKDNLSNLENVISKEIYKELKNVEEANIKERDYLNKALDKVYKTVQLSKLGWINIDKFAKDEVKVNIELNFNLKTNHNEIYIVDQKNSTILNVYDKEINLPINRSFYIIAIGIKGKEMYGYKKSVRFNTNQTFKIDYKKISVAQIKSILTLQNLVNEPNSTLEKKIDSTTIQIDEQEEKVISAPPVTKKKVKQTSFKFKKEPQVLTVNSQKDISFICKEGTKLEIKANAFITSSNKPVEGTIKLNITEYYKLSDILLANLTTVSNGKQLETGGMLFVEAIQNGKRLKLKPNSTIQITFPEKNKKEGMQLFSGAWDDGNINWTLQNNKTVEDDLAMEDIEILELDKENTDVPFSIIENVPVFPGCEKGNNNEKRKCTSEKISAFVSRKFNTELPTEIGLSGKQRINVIFKIDKTGNVIDIQARANHPKLEEEAIRVIGLLPKMTPGMQSGKSVSVPYSLPIIFQVEGVSSVTFNRTNNSLTTTSKKNTTAIKKFEEKITSKESDEVSVSDVNGYVFRTSQLGYINCDRFIRNRSRIKYKIKIKNTEGAIVNMVFKNIKSVMPSWKINEEYDFRSVPKGENVVLIAIKKYAGKLYFDALKTETIENPKLEFNFKLVSLENLKNELKKLDK